MPRPSTRPKSQISAAVTRLRESFGETMEQFARRLRVQLNTVSRWENSLPPSGRSLERLYRVAKRHGPATVEETLLRAITAEKAGQYRRYRLSEILNEGNVQDLRILLRELWDFEEGQGTLSPAFDPVRRDYLLQMADKLFLGGRKELLGEEDQ